MRKTVAGLLTAAFLTGLTLITGCKEYTEEPFAPFPVVTTVSPGLVLINTIEMSGNVSNESGLAVTARGFCWSRTNQLPAIDDDTIRAGQWEGNFSATLKNLTGQTAYFIRAFATTKKGTGYGDVISVMTADTFVTDIDNNKYRAIQVGKLIWMAGNLRVTRFRNGDPIPNVTENTSWMSLSTGAYCWYGNEEAANKSNYGALYNWFAISDSRQIAPQGWHVASDPEWQNLIDSLGGGLIAGGKLKETGTAHWESPNKGATNIAGFTALPGGSRNGSDGTFINIRRVGCWYTSSEYGQSRSLFYRIYNFSTGIDHDSSDKTSGFSVRCVKNNP